MFDALVFEFMGLAMLALCLSSMLAMLLLRRAAVRRAQGLILQVPDEAVLSILHAVPRMKALDWTATHVTLDDPGSAARYAASGERSQIALPKKCRPRIHRKTLDISALSAERLCRKRMDRSWN